MTCCKKDIGIRVAQSFGHGSLMHTLEWARLPGDFIFITVGVPVVIAAFKTELISELCEVGRRI
jgi:hypothetical protein